jgi:hypothetical protein
MTHLTRRDFAHGTIGSLLTFSLLETLFRADAFAQEVKPIAAKWLADLNQLGLDVRGAKLKQIEWQDKTEELFKQVNLPELLKFEKSYRAKFPEVEGLPTKLVFGHQIFALKKNRSVVPHGHDNMATAFLILKGDFDGRHYDRLEDQKDHYIIKPTIDDRFSVGGVSTVSDHKDNVHWFTATSDTAFIFNIHVTNVVQGKTSGRVYVDPKGEKLADGTIRARKLGHTEAHKLYG